MRAGTGRLRSLRFAVWSAVTALLATALLWSAPFTALAKGIIFDTEQGTPGTIVHGRYALLFQNFRTPTADLFLEPSNGSVPTLVTDPAAMVRLGTFAPDGVDGSITFTVPDVAPGSYSIVGRLCSECRGKDDSVGWDGGFFVQAPGAASNQVSVIALLSAISLVLLLLVAFLTPRRFSGLKDVLLLRPLRSSAHERADDAVLLADQQFY